MRHWISLFEQRFKLVTSNPNKLREFGRFGLTLDVEPGKDLPEVQADPITVVLYKARDAGPGRIIEDTSFDINGLDIGVNVRWVVDALKQNTSLSGRGAVWTVMLGMNTGSEINVFQGQIHGHIEPARGDNGFGFDPIFVPNGTTKTLAELDLVGQKDDYSARKAAVQALLSGQSIQSTKLENLPEWTGAYQH